MLFLGQGLSYSLAFLCHCHTHALRTAGKLQYRTYATLPHFIIAHIHTQMCVYVCIHTYMYIYVYTYDICLYVCTLCIQVYVYTYKCMSGKTEYVKNVYVSAYTCAHIHIYVHIHTYIRIYIHVYIYVCVHVSIYMSVYTYTYIYIDVCMHTYIHACKHTSRQQPSSGSRGKQEPTPQAGLLTAGDVDDNLNFEPLGCGVDSEEPKKEYRWFLS